MKAIITRQSGVTGTIDVRPVRKGIPTEILEAAILDMFNSFKGVKSDPFTSVKIIRRQKPLSAK